MVVINRKTYAGNSVVVQNDVVIIDGVVQGNGETLTGIVKIVVTGDLVSLHTDRSVSISGDVNGDVQAGGSVSCKNIAGNTSSGGSVRCGQIGGSIMAGGSVSL